MTPSAIAEGLRVLRHEPDRARLDFGLDMFIRMLEAAPFAPPAAPPPMQDEEQHGNAHYTPEQDATLRRLWAAGASHEAIAEAMGEPGMHRRRIYRRVRRLGLPPRPAVLSETGRAKMAERMSAQFSRWTPARDDALRAGWAAGHTPERILEAVNTLPGDPLTALTVVYDRARKLGLPRRTIAAAASAERLSKMRQAYLEKHQIWTPARDALLIERTDISAADLLPLINALPGDPVKSKTAVNTRRFHLRRLGKMPPGRIIVAPAPPPPRLQAQITPTSVSTFDPLAALAAIRAEATAPEPMSPREQARAALREGRSEAVILRHIAIQPDTLRDLIIEEAALTDQRAEEKRRRVILMIECGASDEAIRQRHGLQLRDIIRLRAEMREAARGRAA